MPTNKRIRSRNKSCDRDFIIIFFIILISQFSACMGKCDLYGLEEPWNELWSNVPKTWIIWTVKRIFHGKTPERSSYILDEATKLISASYQQGYSCIIYFICYGLFCSA
eukprot:Phypoly_transcript_16933.p1 GENE.Phypoly_transcript_16933~~Phypoly_transcript_16933.p1  ORF type:complete len:109 (+),score=3.24 Phypoly_transcript_16933:348-674(+)